MNSILKQTLLDQLDIITEMDRHDYVALEDPDVEWISKLAAGIDGHSVAKSQMRTDFDGVIYIVDWVYGKEFKK